MLLCGLNLCSSLQTVYNLKRILMILKNLIDQQLANVMAISGVATYETTEVVGLGKIFRSPGWLLLKL